MIPCAPTSLLPFQDPAPDEGPLLTSMVERAESMQGDLIPTQKEKSIEALRTFLRSQKHNVETAMQKWQEWITWRHSLKVDEIKEDDIRYELTIKQAYWKGRDKLGRPTCVIIGRNHNPYEQPGGFQSFQKFLIYMTEQGATLADERQQEQVSVIYDRRGLEFKHIDPLLFQASRSLISNLMDFYGHRLGTVYIIHANWLYWTLFHLILRPILGLFFISQRLILVDSPQDLLQYFDQDSLPQELLLPISESVETSNSNNENNNTNNNNNDSSNNITTTTTIQEVTQEQDCMKTPIYKEPVEMADEINKQNKTN